MPEPQDKGRACWKAPERTQYLIEEMFEQIQNGKRADSGFKKEAWTAVKSSSI